MSGGNRNVPQRSLYKQEEEGLTRTASHKTAMTAKTIIDTLALFTLLKILQ